MPTDPTPDPADVELVRNAWRNAPCPKCIEPRSWVGRGRNCRCVLDDDELRDYRARAVLSALADAGHLRQETTMTKEIRIELSGASRVTKMRETMPDSEAEEIQSEEPIPYATTGPEAKPEKAQPHPAVRVATDALAERLEAMWGDTPDGFGRVMLREYADAVAPAVLRWAGDQIRAEAAQLEERDGAGYSYAYGFADAADFIDPTAEGTNHA